jgi:secreted Zn-dependent insulinase-like peptidase
MQKYSNKYGELWYAADISFKLPKILTIFNIILPNSMQTSYARVLNKLFVDILSDTINEKLYPAKLTGNSYSINFSSSGITLEIYGYSDVILNILSVMLDTIREFKCDSERFNVMIEKNISYFKAMESCNTLQQLFVHLDYLYKNNSINYDDAIKYLKSISITDLINYESKLFDQCFYIGLIQGNCDSDKSIMIYEMIQNLISSKVKESSDIFKIDSKCYFTNFLSNNGSDAKIYSYEPFNEKERDTNSSIMIYYDLGDYHYKNNKNRLLLIIFGMMISESFFDKLRTKQQLGYCVQSSSKLFQFLDAYKVGYYFTIQSSQYECEYMKHAIEEFINNIDNELNVNNFNNIITSLIVKLSQPFKTLHESFFHNWTEINSRSFEFDSREKMIEIAKHLTFTDLEIYVKNYITNNKNRAILCVN